MSWRPARSSCRRTATVRRQLDRDQGVDSDGAGGSVHHNMVRAAERTTARIFRPSHDRLTAQYPPAATTRPAAVVQYQFTCPPVSASAAGSSATAATGIA